MMKKSAKELKNMFIESLGNSNKINYIEGNPFLLQIGARRQYIYLKQLSQAYFANSPDITRIQLPYNKHFDKIQKTHIPFIIFGYDYDYDVWVSWSISKIFKRLNSKSNVSLYSRKSFQKRVNNRRIFTEYLSNGDEVYLMKRNHLRTFIIDKLVLAEERLTNKTENITSEDKIYVIDDELLLEKVKVLLYRNRVLEVVEICTKHYKNRYKNMTFKDWFRIIDDLYKKLHKAK